MYNITHEEVSDLMDELAEAEPEMVKGANKNDAAMMKRLKRITMIHSNTENTVSVSASANRSRASAHLLLNTV